MAEARRQPRDSDRPDLAAGAPPAPARAVPDLAGGGLDVAAEPVGERLVVLRIAGEIDMVTAPTLADHVRRHFAAQAGADHPGPKGLVFDLANVDFLGSAGLAVLAEAATLAGEAAVPIRVVATTHAVLRPLQVTGLDAVLTTCADLDAAIQQCSG